MDSRATSIQQLNETSQPQIPSMSQTTMSSQPPQLSMQNAQQHSPTDNELVDDILNEIGTTTPQLNQQIQNTNAELEQHMDTQTKHHLQPSSTQELTDYQDTVSVVDTAKTSELSDGERLLRAQATTAPKSFFESFDMIQFAKTLLLTMILFIVVTNSFTQKMLCKLPYICSTTMVEGIASTQLNFIGTVLLAFVSGLVLSTAQAFV